MNLKYLLTMAVLFFALILVQAQDVTYMEYMSEDGSISFETPEGWEVLPFGGAFTLASEGYVEVSDVQPGQLQVSILNFPIDDFEAMGVARDLSPEEYALALLEAIDDGSQSFTIDETRTITLDNGIEAGVLDISVASAKAVVTVYQEDDSALFVSSQAHESEAEVIAPIATHILNSIQLHESTGSGMLDIPIVNITATNDGVETPPVPADGVPAGMYTFKFTNERSDSSYSPIIARLNEGVTMDAFTEALGVDDGFGAVFLVTLYGGTEVMPESSATMTTELLPGDHLLLEFSPEGPGDFTPFVVAENDMMEETTQPEADITLTMVDFAFGLPPVIPAGELVWNIENAGEQWHEAVIVTVPEGTTVEDIIAASENPEVAMGDSETIFFWAPMGAGVESWTTIHMEPGNYAVLCFLPDIAGDFTPHLMKGMVQVFEVE